MLWEIITLLLAIGLIIILTKYLVLPLIGSFGGASHGATMTNFEGLIGDRKSLQGGVIEALLNDKLDFVATSMPYYIGEDYALIGFDKKWDNNKEVNTIDCSGTKEHLDTPCPGSACLCLYKLSDGKIENKVICRSFEGNLVFLGPAGDEKSTPHTPDTNTPELWNAPGNSGTSKPNPGYSVSIPAGYEFLVIFGKCVLLPPWETQYLYIEKYKQGDTIYMFLARETDDIKLRYQKMVEALTK